MIALIFVPADRLGRFWPYVDGQRITKRSTRQPFYDGARALAAAGYAPETQLDARHQGSDIVAMRSSLGEAARWTVAERDRNGLRRELWRPSPMGDSSTEGATEDSVGED